MRRSLPVWFCLFAATTFAADGVRIEKNVPYLPEGRKETGDLYRPADDNVRHPAVVIIHGGGWTGGKKDAAREINIGTTLAEQGYVCFSIDYLLADDSVDTPCWPQNLYDCKTAVRWLRANADRLSIDPWNIGAIGGSAGGHLTAMLAVTGPECGLDPKGPYGNQFCRIKCAVDMYGPIDVTRWKDGVRIKALKKSPEEAPELYRQFTVTTQLDPRDPPFLILHGTADTTVAVEQSTLFADALKQHGIEYEIDIIEGAPHTFHLQPKQKDLRPEVIAFFDRHLKPKVRISLIGDSTVSDYPNPPEDRPDMHGWGQVLGDKFTTAVTVQNFARSGRSSRSFIREGAWTKVLEQPADYVFIQFGHNDQPGKGDRATDAAGDYRDFLRQYITEARAKGIKPVLVTPVARRTFADGKPTSTLGPYAEAMQIVGKEQSVPVIDLHAKSLALYDKLGDTGSADYTASAVDRTHFSKKGADAMADLVAAELPQAVPELAERLRK
jgi:acetyl esterase/lipase/lysophospholipase L1-like esterase